MKRTESQNLIAALASVAAILPQESRTTACESRLQPVKANLRCVLIRTAGHRTKAASFVSRHANEKNRSLFCNTRKRIPVLSSHPSMAMTFSVWNSGETPIVLAEGPIVAGDAQRLRDALDKVPRDPSGMKTLALNSPGGSVEAAYEIAAVIDAVGVNTAVPRGARCASACAVIVFIAGEYRIVFADGLLSMHSCYDARSGSASDLCNEEVANFAVSQGTSHGSIMRFIGYVPPHEIVWFSAKEVDCWALSRWPADPPENYNQCIVEEIKSLANP